jgi:hypothetical protein
MVQLTDRCLGSQSQRILRWWLSNCALICVPDLHGAKVSTISGLMLLFVALGGVSV